MKWYLTRASVFDHSCIQSGVLGYCCDTHNHAPRDGIKNFTKTRCNIQRSNGTKCSVCHKLLEKIVDANQILFHSKDAQQIMFQSEGYHIHKPPCGSCIQCLFGHKCAITDNIRCNLVSDIETNGKTNIIIDQYFFDHILCPKMDDWYICEHHKHHHSDKSLCLLMNVKCCNYAVPFFMYKQSFSIKLAEGLYFPFVHPSSWEDQIKNYFMSMLKYLLCDHEKFASTHQYLEKSLYKFGRISTNVSGKFSIIRSGITGLFATGLYQTGTMDSSQHFSDVVVPEKLLKFLDDRFFTDSALINRDPSINTTCMYAVDLKKGDGETIVISDTIAKPMNQDNDGDRNPLYFISKETAHLVTNQMARIEILRAKETYITNLALPRLSFSEYARIKLERHRRLYPKSELSSHEFLQKRGHLSYDIMIETGCQYDRKIFMDFFECLRKNISEEDMYMISIDDLDPNSVMLSSIYQSGAKGSKEHVDLLLESISAPKSFDKEKMFKQMIKYVTSSQSMSIKGRMQFVMLIFLHDVVLTNGLLFMGNQLMADVKPSETSIFAVFNPGSLKCAASDLMNNLDHSL